jgi:predicted metal-dependent hydrolase
VRRNAPPRRPTVVTGPDLGPSSAGGPSIETVARKDVEVRRSRRRRRTVSAYRDGGRVVVLIPESFSAADEAQWVERMVARLGAQDGRRPRTDEALTERALVLSERYLGGHAVPTSVRWVTTMSRRWGSCTPSQGTIRLSDRLRGVPPHVLDYVLLHELAHLLVPGHGPRFWRLLSSYPRLERARGFLDGMAYAQGLPLLEDSDAADGDTSDPE